jgi:hypothetical protein
MPPPDLVAKLPSVKLPIPPIPTIELPTFDPIKFNTLFDYSLFVVKLPSLLADVALKIPSMILDLPQPPKLFGAVCQIAFNAKLFGDLDPGSVTQIVATKVLTRRIVEMIFIAAVGTTLGSSSGGIVGGLGTYLGYTPPVEDVEEEEQSPRDKIVEYALSCAGLSWGNKDTRDQYAQKLLYVEYPEKSTDENTDPRARGAMYTIDSLKLISSCGLLARACLFNGGASYVFDSSVDTSKRNANVKLYYDFFQDTYRTDTAIAGLIGAAAAKGAFIPKTKKDLPPLQKGDVIIVNDPNVGGREHAIVLVNDYVPGSFMMTTVEGGQQDKDNKDGSRQRPTAIKMRNYSKNPSWPEPSLRIDASGEVIVGGRKIYRIIDGEKMCTDRTGSNMNVSNGPIDTTVAKDGPGDIENANG